MSGRLGRRWWLVFFFLAAVLATAAFFLDASVQAWMSEIRTPSGRSFLRQVTRWGDWPTHIVLGLLGAGVAYARKNRIWLVIFLAMVIACATAGLVNRAVKMTTGRSRPSVKIDVGWNGPRLGSKFHSFPSGHTAATVAFFATLVFARPRLGLALLPVPLLVAGSRLYLNAHYFSDVVVGALLGVGCAALIWRLVITRSPFAHELREASDRAPQAA